MSDIDTESAPIYAEAIRQDARQSAGKKNRDLYAEAIRQNARRPAGPRRQVTVAQPKSAEEIAGILTDNVKYPSPVRPLGSSSSVTRCATTAAGTLIDMSLLDHVLSETEDTITVQAGIRLRDLAEHLADQGKELLCGCVNPNRTVGGAVSSGTLGGGMAGSAAQLASSVIAITLINGMGRRVEVTEKLPDLLVLTRMSYGLFGVVYSVKLRTRPIRSYTARNSKTDIDDLASLIPTLLQVQGAVKASLMPFRNRAYIELRYPDDLGRTSATLPWKLRDWATNNALPSMVRSVKKIVPVANLRDPLIDGVTEATHVLFGSTMVAASSSNAADQTGRFKLAENPDSRMCVWFFPADHVPAMLSAFREFSTEHYRETRYRCDLPTELLRIDRDQHALLSPSFDGPVFAMHLQSTNKAGWEEYLLEFADFAERFDGVPVFNQTRGIKPGYAAKVYGERLRRFSDIRKRLDPNDRLLNQFFAEHLR